VTASAARPEGAPFPAGMEIRPRLLRGIAAARRQAAARLCKKGQTNR